MRIQLLRVLSGFKFFFQSTWKFFTGVIVAIVGFSTNFTDFKQPDLTIEITSVATTSSEPIDLVKVPELAALAELMERPFAFMGKENTGVSADDIERQLLIQANNVAARTQQLDRTERELNALISSPTKDQESSLKRLLRDSLISPIDFTSEEQAADPKKVPTSQERIDRLVVSVRAQIDSGKKQFGEISAKLKDAEKQWAAYRDAVLPNRARLMVTAAIGNRGSGATSLKPQGLLRANLGDGNYLDLSMKLSGYESSPDLSALASQSFKVVRFQSDEVQSMNPADRQRFKTFLGNVSPATIYISDVRGRTYLSNSVPFSPGVYEQKVYDSLKQFASRSSNR